MTYIYVQTPKQDPQCPQCKTILKGWSSPDDLTLSQTLLAFLSLCFLLAQVIGGVVGATNEKRCSEWPQTYGQILLPAMPVGCYAAEFFSKRIGDDNG